MRASVCRLSARNPRTQQAAFVWKWLRRYCPEPGVIASIFIVSAGASRRGDRCCRIGCSDRDGSADCSCALIARGFKARHILHRNNADDRNGWRCLTRFTQRLAVRVMNSAPVRPAAADCKRELNQEGDSGDHQGNQLLRQPVRRRGGRLDLRIQRQRYAQGWRRRRPARRRQRHRHHLLR